MLAFVRAYFVHKFTHSDKVPVSIELMSKRYATLMREWRDKKGHTGRLYARIFMQTVHRLMMFDADETSAPLGMMALITDDYIDQIGVYMRTAHAEMAKTLKMTSQQFDTSAINNLVQSQKRSGRFFMTSIDPKSANPVQARSERHVHFSTVRTMREIRAMGMGKPEASKVSAAHAALFTNNQMNTPYARSISLQTALYTPCLKTIKEYDVPTYSIAPTVAGDDDDVSTTVNLAFDLPITLKIAGDMCGYLTDGGGGGGGNGRGGKAGGGDEMTYVPYTSTALSSTSMSSTVYDAGDTPEDYYDDEDMFKPFPLLAKDSSSPNIVRIGSGGAMRSCEDIAADMRLPALHMANLGLERSMRVGLDVSKLAITWVLNYLQNRRTERGGVEHPTLITAVIEDLRSIYKESTTMASQLGLWLIAEDIFADPLSRKVINRWHANVLMSLSDVIHTQMWAPLITRSCHRDRNRTALLNVLCGAAELYGAMHRHNTRADDLQYERDADAATIVVGASLRLQMGPSAIGKTAAEKTSAASTATTMAANGPQATTSGQNGAQRQIVRVRTTLLDTGLVPLAIASDNASAQSDTSAMKRAARNLPMVLFTTHVDTQSFGYACDVVMPFSISNYSSTKNKDSVFTKLKSGKGFQQRTFCARISNCNNVIATPETTLLKRTAVHFPNGVYVRRPRDDTLAQMAIDQVVINNKLDELAQLINMPELNTINLARYIVSNTVALQSLRSVDNNMVVDDIEDDSTTYRWLDSEQCSLNTFTVMLAQTVGSDAPIPSRSDSPDVLDETRANETRMMFAQLIAAVVYPVACGEAVSVSTTSTLDGDYIARMDWMAGTGIYDDDDDDAEDHEDDNAGVAEADDYY